MENFPYVPKAFNIDPLDTSMRHLRREMAGEMLEGSGHLKISFYNVSFRNGWNNQHKLK